MLLKRDRLVMVLIAVSAVALAAAQSVASAASQDPEALRAKFEFLSANGNSNCSASFMEAIPAMEADARLQGSCCSPMNLHRYGEQIEGLKAFSKIKLVPSDPYDIPAPLAARLMEFYEAPLSPEQQAAYDYAMENSNEGGPCCCGCWRWYTYGGLAKHLIRDVGFGGEQIAEIWDLSDGCGGESHMHDESPTNQPETR